MAESSALLQRLMEKQERNDDRQNRQEKIQEDFMRSINETLNTLMKRNLQNDLNTAPPVPMPATAEPPPPLTITHPEIPSPTSPETTAPTGPSDAQSEPEPPAPTSTADRTGELPQWAVNTHMAYSATFPEKERLEYRQRLKQTGNDMPLPPAEVVKKAVETQRAAIQLQKQQQQHQLQQQQQQNMTQDSRGAPQSTTAAVVIPLDDHLTPNPTAAKAPRTNEQTSMASDH